MSPFRGMRTPKKGVRRDSVLIILSVIYDAFDNVFAAILILFFLMSKKWKPFFRKYSL